MMKIWITMITAIGFAAPTWAGVKLEIKNVPANLTIQEVYFSTSSSLSDDTIAMTVLGSVADSRLDGIIRIPISLLEGKGLSTKELMDMVRGMMTSYEYHLTLTGEASTLSADGTHFEVRLLNFGFVETANTDG